MSPCPPPPWQCREWLDVPIAPRPPTAAWSPCPDPLLSPINCVSTCVTSRGDTGGGRTLGGTLWAWGAGGGGDIGSAEWKLGGGQDPGGGHRTWGGIWGPCDKLGGRRGKGGTPRAPPPPPAPSPRGRGSAFGHDMEVSPTELMNILNKVVTRHPDLKTDGFGIDTCRSMVAVMDVSFNFFGGSDTTGKLGFEEFKYLWNNIKKWQCIYKQFDSDRSGTIGAQELPGAFQAAGG
uniref:Calpain small subunit 1 n=1 Tax=Nothoprocta perdicaria TaxID=30464 RepID=A0A8C6ZH96_NOTPE